MEKHSIDGEIDFYKELEKSICENDNSLDENICLITKHPLVDNSVKLNCCHSFNYSSIYKDYLQQKMNSFNVRDNKSLLKCPYCRKIQKDMLPYYPELSLKLIYGINTLDIVYKLIKDRHNKFVYANTINYFTGKCNFVESSIVDGTEHSCSCLKTSVILHGETQKTYCFQHISLAKKEYLYQEKEKKRALKKQETVLKKEEEKKQKALKKEEEKKMKKLEQNINTIIGGNPLVAKCDQILKSGKNKGLQCSCNIFENGKCKKHSVKSTT